MQLIMGKRTVLFFTDRFPYGNGETFIELEMDEWGKRNDVELKIIPLLARSTDNCRAIPSNAEVDLRLSKVLFSVEKWILLFFPLIFLNPFFWKEIFNYPKVLAKPKQLRRLVAVSTFSKVTYWFLKKNYTNVLTKENTFYSYWFYYAAYAGALLKRDGYMFKLITRAHGVDIFQNRTDTDNYIPYRRFPVWKYFYTIYPVSKKGAHYLHTNQNIPIHKISVSYLGVKPQEFICQPSKEKTINLVSCSNLIPLKRINLIVSGIARYAENNSNINLKWYHIGDGPLRKELEAFAYNKLKSNNVEFSFLGNLKNSDVIKFYKNTCLDSFITTSESEGLPVSIMEAIMVGLPVIATDVGGINEAINISNGILLETEFKQIDFELAMHKIQSFKTIEQRNEIARNSRQKFDSAKNIGNFIEMFLA